MSWIVPGLFRLGVIREYPSKLRNIIPFFGRMPRPLWGNVAYRSHPDDGSMTKSANSMPASAGPFLVCHRLQSVVCTICNFP